MDHHNPKNQLLALANSVFDPSKTSSKQRKEVFDSTQVFEHALNTLTKFWDVLEENYKRLTPSEQEEVLINFGNARFNVEAQLQEMRLEKGYNAKELLHNLDVRVCEFLPQLSDGLSFAEVLRKDMSIFRNQTESVINYHSGFSEVLQLRINDKLRYEALISALCARLVYLPFDVKTVLSDSNMWKNKRLDEISGLSPTASLSEVLGIDLKEECCFTVSKCGLKAWIFGGKTLGTENQIEVLIVFKGTSSLVEIFLDLLLVGASWSSDNQLVHGGFLFAYKFMKDDIFKKIDEVLKICDYDEKYPKVIFNVVGHSLGASLAEMLSLEIARKYKSFNKIRAWTFASPGYGFSNEKDLSDYFKQNVLHLSYHLPHDPIVIAGKLCLEQIGKRYQLPNFNFRFYEAHGIENIEFSLAKSVKIETNMIESRNVQRLPLLASQVMEATILSTIALIIYKTYKILKSFV